MYSFRQNWIQGVFLKVREMIVEYNAKYLGVKCQKSWVLVSGLTQFFKCSFYVVAFSTRFGVRQLISMLIVRYKNSNIQLSTKEQNRHWRELISIQQYSHLLHVTLLQRVFKKIVYNKRTFNRNHSKSNPIIESIDQKAPKTHHQRGRHSIPVWFQVNVVNIPADRQSRSERSKTQVNLEYLRGVRSGEPVPPSPGGRFLQLIP